MPWTPEAQALLEGAIAQRGAGQVEQAEFALAALCEAHPELPEPWYHLAWARDLQGKEAEAAPAYEQAIALGLLGEALQGALLGLGSTYRWLGQSAEAIATLERGVEAFPEDEAMRVFRALAWHQGGRSDEAVAELLELLVATSAAPRVKTFGKALGYAVAELRGEPLG